MPNWIRQAAAIPVFDGKICMVTSRSGRRWVLPKGRIERGQTPAQAALVESWEEAGLVGTLQDEPAGAYCYEKYDREHHVLVFHMTVTEIRSSWPERHEREREWLTVNETIERIAEPGLRNILRVMFPPKSPRRDSEPRNVFVLPV